MNYIIKKLLVGIVVILLLTSCSHKNNESKSFNKKGRIHKTVSNSQTSVNTTTYYYNNKNEVVKTLTIRCLKESGQENTSISIYNYNSRGEIIKWTVNLNYKEIQNYDVGYISNKIVVVRIVQNKDTIYHKYVLGDNGKAIEYYQGENKENFTKRYLYRWKNGDNVLTFGKYSYRNIFENITNPIPPLGEETWKLSKHLVSAMIMNNDTVIVSKYELNKDKLVVRCITNLNFIVKDIIDTKYFYEE